MVGKNVLFAVLLLGVFAAAFIAYSLVTANGPALPMGDFSHSEERFQAFAEAELPDACIAPAGYSQEEWEEHISHHPGRYKECF